jgi:protein-disulfide isomerase
MRSIYAILFIILCISAASAQTSDEVLATATGHTFKYGDLPVTLQAQLAKLPGELQRTRTEIMEQMINERVLSAEARTRQLSVGEMIKRELASIPAPTDAAIKAVYEANKNALGGKTLEQVRKQIVDFLRREPEQQRLNALITSLRSKYKVVLGKDVKSPGLSPDDIVATVNGKPITARDFEAEAKLELYGMRADYADLLLASLNDAIYLALVNDEAKAQGIDAGALIAREVTSKLKDYSDEEQEAVLAAFTQKLFTKYQVKILYTAPEPIVENISVDDDPARGPAGAPVTVVMFSDFQCSACSAVHPVLKAAMVPYADKIRFVVRDFPLESIHENAFKAALAAGAANAQGKFFEYTELLYTRQDALDDASLKKYAAELGLNVKQFELDFNSEKTAAEVRKDIADGESYSINSTPTIFINGVRVRDLSPGGLRRSIERALRK